MKVCPQCNVAYQDDYVFCLNDGNSLIDESGEQETRLVNKLVFPEKTSALSPDLLIGCVSCGLANRANSRFCKKCGSALGDQSDQGNVAEPANNGVFGFDLHSAGQPPASGRSAFPSASDHTVQFSPVTFTPPQSLTQAAPGRSGLTMNIAIACTLIVLVAIIVALLVSSGNNVTVNSTNSNGSNSSNRASASPANVNSEPKRNTSNQSSEVGRIGRLTNNTNIRAASNRGAEIIGTHYQRAKVEVLEVDSYPTNEGHSTWYRVKILENGCDVITNNGCGNNWERNGSFGWMEAEMVGWMNAKYISLD